MVQRPIGMQRAAAWEGGGARQRMMSPESSSAQRGARVATPGPHGGARLTGHEGWAAGWEFNIQGGIFFFFFRQGRLPEGCARLEGEASGRRVASACYSAPLRPSRVLHAPHQPDSYADRGTARRVPPADGSLRPAYRGNDQAASAAIQDSRVRLTAGWRPCQALAFRTS